MKNLFRLVTVAALLSGGFLFAAEDTAPAKKGKGDTAQGVEGARKRNKADEALTPEQREARRKEALAKREAKLKELKEKKAAGTLSEKEQKQLDRLEKAGKPGSGGRRPGGGKKGEPAK